MKKKTLCATILAAGSLFAALQQDDMKLVNTRTGFVVVEFKDGKSIFNDRFLEAEMKDKGIAIPQNLRADFDNKSAVFPGDPLFQKAFTDIYVPLTIASPVYQWKK
jgi:hypothetical protein